MIYLDNAATTPVDEKYLNIFCKYQCDNFYNPSAMYGNALKIAKDMNEARNRILTALSGDGRIIFTSGGTESDNTALFGTRKAKNSRVIISSVEHPAIYNAAMDLKQKGYDVVEVKTDSVGKVDFENFKELLTENTSLISIMHVNNETGAINDIKKLVKYAKSKVKNVIFHSDGVQAVGKVSVNLRDLGVDLYSISGHKLFAPKGIGCLYIRNGVNIKPFILGGGQEFGLRSSTENVGGAVALSYAIADSVDELDLAIENEKKYIDEISKTLKTVDDEILVLHDENCSSSVLMIASNKVKGEVLLRSLETQGVIIGTGSACSQLKSIKRIPMALNIPSQYINGIIRLSFSRKTSKNDIDYFINKFKTEYLKLENIR